MIRALVFDLDDTLYPEQQYVLSGFRAVSAWFAEEYGICGFFEEAEKIFNAGHRGKIFDRTLVQLGVHPEATLVGILVNIYRQHDPVLSLYPDAAWALEHFQSSTVLGLLTDGYLEVQRRKVGALGIDRVFNAIVYSDEFGKDSWKPSPTPYLKLMELTNLSGSECVYIGDNPMKDFVTAKELGWLTVQISRAGGEYFGVHVPHQNCAHLRVHSLQELNFPGS